MTKTELRRLHLRFVLLAIVVLVCFFVSSAYIRKNAKTYDFRLTGYEGREIKLENVSVSPESMARITDLRQDADGVYVAVIEGLEPGEGALLVTLEGAGGMSALEVKKGPIVIGDGINFKGWEALAISAIICFAVAGLLCAWALQTLRSRAWYGYEMAAYASGALFCLAEAGVFAWLFLSGKTGSTQDFALAVTEMATRFVRLLLIPMAVGAIFVSLSNIALVRHEGRSLTNLLGIAVSLALAMALLIMRFFDLSAIGATTFKLFIIIAAFDSVFSIGVCFALALLTGAATCAYGAARHVPSFPRDYLMILGCGLRADGSPTPLLAGRVDAARAFARSQEEAGLPAPTFVPSGGQGSDEVCSEAESMRRYLVEQGVDENKVLLEDRSTNTRENFAYAAEVIAGAHHQRMKPRVAFSTTNYHVFRGYVYAHDAGLDAEGIAAPTKLYFWPNAFLREFVGLLAARALPIALAFIVIAGLYLFVEYALLLA